MTLCFECKTVTTINGVVCPHCNSEFCPDCVDLHIVEFRYNNEDEFLQIADTKRKDNDSETPKIIENSKINLNTQCFYCDHAIAHHIRTTTENVVPMGSDNPDIPLLTIIQQDHFECKFDCKCIFTAIRFVKDEEF